MVNEKMKSTIITIFLLKLSLLSFEQTRELTDDDYNSSGAIKLIFETEISLAQELEKKDIEIVVFLDGDYSDNPKEIIQLIEPIKKNEYEFVVGSRVLGKCQKGSLKAHQIFGNKLATFLIRIFFGGLFTDLGPFRAIKYDSLSKLSMKDKTYGWTVEMQIKAVKQRLKYMEVPVSYKPRIGKSKVSGTIKGSIKAGTIILLWIFKSLFKYSAPP